MTQSTEQERASLRAFIEMAEREGFDTAHQWYESKGWVFFSPSTADCWRYWQAARRAQVVPQGWKLVPVEPTRAMMSSAVMQAEGDAAYKVATARWLEAEEREYGDAYQAMLAAAPQPPEEQDVLIKAEQSVGKSLVSSTEFVGHQVFSHFEARPLSNSFCHAPVQAVAVDTMGRVIPNYSTLQTPPPAPGNETINRV